MQQSKGANFKFQFVQNRMLLEMQQGKNHSVRQKRGWLALSRKLQLANTFDLHPLEQEHVSYHLTSVFIMIVSYLLQLQIKFNINVLCTVILFYTSSQHQICSFILKLLINPFMHLLSAGQKRKQNNNRRMLPSKKRSSLLDWILSANNLDS